MEVTAIGSESVWGGSGISAGVNGPGDNTRISSMKACSLASSCSLALEQSLADLPGSSNFCLQLLNSSRYGN